ncbi:MAG: AMP-binding protein, partial [Acidobacteriota bacterium]
MIEPKSHISQHAKIDSLDAYRALYRRSIEEPEAFWSEQARRLDWFREPSTAGRWDYEAVDFAWFEGGRLNACHECVDRHLAERGDQTAIIWAKDEPGEYEHISYRELHRRVGRMANVLAAHGVGRGDRVALYLPMIPELAVTMLACARLGAVHSIVFAGFSAEALR